VFRAFYNGVLNFSYDTASDPVKLTSGNAGLITVGNYTDVTWSAFTCGGPTSATTLATGDFSGGTAQVMLTAAYPETNVTGKSFAISFKGTATDGTDPGADLTTLALMTQGVRNPARVCF